MSTKQTAIRKSFNIPAGELVRVSGGFFWAGSLRKLVGVKRIQRIALTGTAKETVQSSPVIMHKWAARVGMYNEDPIWGEIFQNVRVNRKRLREESRSKSSR